MGFHSPRFPHLPKNLSVFLITNIKIILIGPMSRFRWQVPLWQQILILDELGFPVDSCPRLTIPTACLRNYLLFRSKEICKMLNAGMLELYYVLVCGPSWAHSTAEQWEGGLTLAMFLWAKWDTQDPFDFTLLVFCCWWWWWWWCVCGHIQQVLSDPGTT